VLLLLASNIVGNQRGTAASLETLSKSAPHRINFTALFTVEIAQVVSTMAMQKLQPRVKEIQNKYKGDQEKAQLEVARLYREAQVSRHIVQLLSTVLCGQAAWGVHRTPVFVVSCVGGCH